ncbi:MAG TPA: NrfD/PsrC family molybdoenzyme membrane anchor subunit [Stenomitos sp.]
MAVPHRHPLPSDEQIVEDILRPMARTTWRFWLLVAVLLVIIGAGAGAYLYMAMTGMGVTGLSRPNMWGMLIANFVFWIGLSHSGTLISAILRLTNAEWRRPVVRAAEAMTLFTIMVAGLFPIIHLGRSWLFYWLLPYPSERMIWPNFRSPLLWDFMAITTYLTGSTMYFYLPLIPDLATVRDRSTGWKRRIYGILSFGWRGTTVQWQRLERALAILAVTILPVAVSVHTIVSWDFAMAIAPPLWHTTVFGPYFVAGAIYSGLALVITVMATLRWVYKLETYLRPEHFDKMGKILLTISLIWFYLWWADFLTGWYGRVPDERHAWMEYLFGRFALLSWTMLICNAVLPPLCLSFKRFRQNIPLMVILTLLINVGMYIERILIVVPPLTFKRFPWVWGGYWPSWVEWTIWLAAFAGFTLLYTVFSKLIPLVAIWEVREERIYMTRKQVGKHSYPAVALPETGQEGGHG